MARHEADREDLMREATALKRRMALTIPDDQEQLIIGFRSTGALSLYFGPDPVYHFDPEHRLRRGYIDGHLIRTQGNTLAKIKRVRLETITEMRRTDLDEPGLQSTLKTIRQRLSSLLSTLESASMTVDEQFPTDDESLLDDLQMSVKQILEGGIKLAPAIKGKR